MDPKARRKEIEGRTLTSEGHIDISTLTAENKRFLCYECDVPFSGTSASAKPIRLCEPTRARFARAGLTRLSEAASQEQSASNPNVTYGAQAMKQVAHCVMRASDTVTRYTVGFARMIITSIAKLAGSRRVIKQLPHTDEEEAVISASRPIPIPPARLYQEVIRPSSDQYCPYYAASAPPLGEQPSQFAYLAAPSWLSEPPALIQS